MCTQATFEYRYVVVLKTSNVPIRFQEIHKHKRNRCFSKGHVGEVLFFTLEVVCKKQLLFKSQRGWILWCCMATAWPYGSSKSWHMWISIKKNLSPGTIESGHVTNTMPRNCNHKKHQENRKPLKTNPYCHRIHEWYIYLHLVDVFRKCRYIYIYMYTITWILWVSSNLFCRWVFVKLEGSKCKNWFIRMGVDMGTTLEIFVCWCICFVFVLIWFVYFVFVFVMLVLFLQMVVCVCLCFWVLLVCLFSWFVCHEWLFASLFPTFFLTFVPFVSIAVLLDFPLKSPRKLSENSQDAPLNRLHGWFGVDLCLLQGERTSVFRILESWWFKTIWLLMEIQKSGINSPVEGKVVYPTNL